MRYGDHQNRGCCVPKCKISSLLIHSPENLHFFVGGENDYSKFISGNYKHIIFNLSLQEGWDDPECYLGYIDKNMGSRIQVEQIIGRVLRQPGAKHYSDFRLDTCLFYINVIQKGFSRISYRKYKQNFHKTYLLLESHQWVAQQK